MNRRFDALSWMWTEALAAEPPVDVYETDEGLTILVALPGIPADRVALFVDAQGLVVQTKRVPTAARTCRQIHRMEIPYGTYERRIRLPAGRYTLQQQRMADGCLEIYLTRE